MTKFTVQFELPVDNPMNNVRIKRSKMGVTFFVPINYPDIHSLTYSDLIAAVELSGLLHISTPLNNTKEVLTKSTIKR
jgi:hypothetical protein